MEFNYWLNQVADMPSKVDGQWVDLETGIHFSDHAKPKTPVKRPVAATKHVDAGMSIKQLASKLTRLLSNSARALEHSVSDLPVTAEFVTTATALLEEMPSKKAPYLAALTLCGDSGRERNAAK